MTSSARYDFINPETSLAGARAIASVLLEMVPGQWSDFDEMNRFANLIGALEVCLDVVIGDGERKPEPVPCADAQNQMLEG